ncbi:LysR substrate-binding domain-containing protein [Amycolatopsis lexingtonensis]|uniref:LysR substrate-binding domain-containing protein n=1 Tax=Amycolatopsis lexingtonensis TaxID=218822 RepID=UPI003F70F74E
MHLDLNLLTVFDALLEEGSVMGAAERLHLSSPAVSRTLGRLRKVTGDDILVRTGHTMAPTPYALAVREDVHRLVRQAREVLTPARELDLAELDRTFTIQCHDALAASVVPVLVGRLMARAPGVRLRVLAENSADTDDLRHGRVDLELGGARPELPEFRSEVVGHDSLVVAMRPGHPCADGLDLRAYAAHPHVVVSRRGRLTAPIDDVLAAEGLRRRVVAAVATLSMALQTAARGDVLVTCTAILGRPLVDAFGLVTRPLPADSPAAAVSCTWHQRYDSDPAHAWLREQVSAALDEIVAG